MLARCIAMVVIWNDLACGDREAAAVLVALNSVFQVVAFSLLGWLYLSVLPGWLGLETTGLNVSGWEIARSVLIFLGIPLAAGFLTRKLGEKARGRTWYEAKLIPRIGPFALCGLLQASDVVVTMGCGEACPAFPGKKYLDWELDDPAGQGVEAVRSIRDEIEARIHGLLAELLPSDA